MLIGICDDEPEVIRCIKELIDGYQDGKPYQDEMPYLEIVTFQSGRDLLDSGKIFDLVFLDIQMPDLDGIAVADQLQSRNGQTMIIFVSAHNQYVRKGYELGVFQFLIKPIVPAEFNHDFARAIRSYQKQHQDYPIRTIGGDRITVSIGDIVYFQVWSHKLDIHLQDGQVYTIRGKMATEEAKLKSYDFVRSENGFLVNLKYVSNVEDSDIYLSTHQDPLIILPISKRKHREVLSAYNHYVSRMHR